MAFLCIPQFTNFNRVAIQQPQKARLENSGHLRSEFSINFFIFKKKSNFEDEKRSAQHPFSPKIRDF